MTKSAYGRRIRQSGFSWGIVGLHRLGWKSLPSNSRVLLLLVGWTKCLKVVAGALLLHDIADAEAIEGKAAQTRARGK